MREPVLDYLSTHRDLLSGEGAVALDCCAGPVDYGLGDRFPGMTFESCDQISFPDRTMTFVCDVHDLATIPDSRYAAVFLLEALEHIERPHEALAAIHRVLRSGGVLAITTVMDFPVHRHPRDFWRFCPDGLAVLLDGFRIEDLTLEGRREKPQGLWAIARKQEGSWRDHNLEWAEKPNRVHNSLTRWFAFKEDLHYRIGRLFFGRGMRPPPGRY